MKSYKMTKSYRNKNNQEKNPKTNENSQKTTKKWYLSNIFQVFLITHQYDKIPIEHFFTMNTNSTRGHKYRLVKQLGSSPIRRHSFFYRVVNLWNDLPAIAVECTSINSFKNTLAKAWKNDPIKYQFE